MRSMKSGPGRCKRSLEIFGELKSKERFRLSSEDRFRFFRAVLLVAMWLSCFILVFSLLASRLPRRVDEPQKFAVVG